ncbi:GNAT family N-acetyltransferase [Kribbella sancticallisti]|uniref:GNAT family N-acetyltransferase n=1 Tax=Kribbella sancticallisti TaxID=460087 RepID=A0ABN2D5D5_9ACTN
MTDSIRRARPDDAATVRTLLGELADHQEEGEYVRSTPEQWREFLGRDEVIVLLAERDGHPTGYVSALRRPQLWTGQDILALDDLYVREEFRDAGVGRALMLELARHALPEQLTIGWGVRPDNVQAHRFYARLGAALRPKVVASWSADAYADLLTSSK